MGDNIRQAGDRQAETRKGWTARHTNRQTDWKPDRQTDHTLLWM